MTGIRVELLAVVVDEHETSGMLPTTVCTLYGHPEQNAVIPLKIKHIATAIIPDTRFVHARYTHTLLTRILVES